MNQEYQLKNSKVEWFGRIPTHWKWGKQSVYVNFKVGFTPSTSNLDFYTGKIPWVTIEDMDKKIIIESKDNITEEAILGKADKLVPKGSLMYSFKLSVGKAAFAGRDLYTNEAIASFLPSKKVDLSFLYYALQDYLIFYAKYNIYNAPLLNSTLISCSKLLVPPSKEEQIAIAKYLDEICSEIDKTIEFKEEQIKKIDLFFASKIHETVTKGLDKNVELKSSKVEWFGKIPKNWRKEKLGHILKEVVCGGTPESKNFDYWSIDETGIPWVNIADITAQEVITKTEKRITEEGFKSKNMKLLPKGTLLYSIFASLGKIAILGIESTTNQAILGLIPTKKIDNIYLKYFLLDLERILVKFSTSTTQYNLNSTTVRDFRILLPSKDEQTAIAIYLNNLKKNVDNLKETLNNQISLLTEYRKSVIHECVTGKKRVYQGEIENAK